MSDHATGEPDGSVRHDLESGSDCSQTLHRLFEYLDGEMTPDDTARIAEHLRSCEPCLAEHDLDQALKVLIKQACPCEEAPVALRTTIIQRITTVTWRQ